MRQHTLMLYRQALSCRRKLQTAESMQWMPGTNGQVLYLGHPLGWRSVTNFGPGAGAAAVRRRHPLQCPGPGDHLPADTTTWILTGS